MYGLEDDVGNINLKEFITNFKNKLSLLSKNHYWHIILAPKVEYILNNQKGLMKISIDYKNKNYELLAYTLKGQ